MPNDGGENDAMMLAIGQSHLMVTPLQAAAMMASSPTAASGSPRTPPRERPRAGPLNISADTLKEVRQGLYDVTHSSGGTAHSTRLREFKAVGRPAPPGGGRQGIACLVRRVCPL